MELRNLKVKDLIKDLEKYNPELPVYLEGCDCTGKAEGTQLFLTDEQIAAVLITHHQ